METDTIEGMQAMHKALYEQILKGRLSEEAALKASPDSNALKLLIRTGGLKGSATAREWMMNT